ncbi:nucleotidyltransferase family protein [Aliiglaciecola litoralis]|uniref:Nucleotidyltransferase family protein n=1 Tax=Aliiglaciecola litoralis TaxID=582857 RepID=A0ABN1LBL6_9ALTE
MLAGMVLAAGASSRFGAIKQLQSIDSQTMLNIAIEKLANITDNKMVVVLGANHEIIKASIPNQMAYTVAEDWQMGMAASIKQGLQHLIDHYGDKMSHLLILLADQVAIDLNSLQLLIRAQLQYPQQITAAKYNGILGAPAIFPKAFFANLATLSGQQGAKSIINQFIQQVNAVELPLAKIDIDTVQDLREWQTGANTQHSED